jgi:hypothetical protein
LGRSKQEVAHVRAKQIAITAGIALVVVFAWDRYGKR